MLPLLFVGICLVARLELGDNDTEMAYVVLPVTCIFLFLFLFLAVLLLNSLWFQKSEGHTLFGTIAAFALYLLLREFCLFLLVLGDGIVILFWQHRVQAQRRTALLEQYLPLVEELIEQVRRASMTLTTR